MPVFLLFVPIALCLTDVISLISTLFALYCRIMHGDMHNHTTDIDDVLIVEEIDDVLIELLFNN